MNYLGIDYGEKRIGVAHGDSIGIAFPLPAILSKNNEERMEKLEAIIKQKKIGKIIIGYPYNMDGTIGFKAKEVDAFISIIETRFLIEVIRVDETLSTYAVEDSLKREGKKTSRDRETRATGTIDSRAAALILQDYLDANVHTAGHILGEEEA